jgi:hypothetical protein
VILDLRFTITLVKRRLVVNVQKGLRMRGFRGKLFVRQKLVPTGSPIRRHPARRSGGRDLRTTDIDFLPLINADKIYFYRICNITHETVNHAAATAVVEYSPSVGGGRNRFYLRL